MKRQSFYDNQLVDNTDLNAAVANADDADCAIAKEASGYGITSGMEVVSYGGQMKIAVNTGTLIDKTGQRCALAGPHAQTITQATDATPVAVGAGQERWVAVFAKINRKLTGYQTDPSGGVHDITNYTVQEPIVNPTTAVADAGGADVNTTQILYVVAGAAAAIGSATRPALDAAAILICDLNVRNGQADYTGLGTIDFQRTEMFRKVEPDASSFAPEGLAYFSLVRQFQRGQLITREYVSRTGGTLTTVNAQMIASALKTGDALWGADDYAEDSLAFSLGSAYGNQGNHFAGLFSVFAIQGGTKSVPWTWADWGAAAKISLFA